VTEKKTIKEVVNTGLCTGCGTCESLCPHSAIKIVNNEPKGLYVPCLDDGECNLCGVCFNSCPGHGVDFRKLNLELFGKEPEDIFLGNYLNCYDAIVNEIHEFWFKLLLL